MSWYLKEAGQGQSTGDRQCGQRGQSQTKGPHWSAVVYRSLSELGLWSPVLELTGTFMKKGRILSTQTQNQNWGCLAFCISVTFPSNSSHCAERALGAAERF